MTDSPAAPSGPPTVRYRRHRRSALSGPELLELQVVDKLASDLDTYLLAHAEEIDHVHVHGAGSKAVQNVVAGLLVARLDFHEEKVLTPQSGFVTHARPDFVHRLGDRRGVIAEVERGGTTTNNHDLKDLWKAHIADDVQHLFLVVPLANWTQGGLARERPFLRVCNRLSAFFGDPRREVDVNSVHVFGYGRETLTAPTPAASDAHDT